jgi:hypothetical protein
MGNGRTNVQPENRFVGLKWISATILITFVAPAGLFFLSQAAVENSLPEFPECVACSAMNEPLSTLAGRWKTPVLAAEDAAFELEVLQSAIAGLRAANSRGPEYETCFTALLARYDDRLNEFSRGIIESLVGCGADDACPRLHELLRLSDRLKKLMSSDTTMETPKCAELLEWHSRFYSCSNP